VNRVYKIFGENAEKMLEEANRNVDAKTFQDNGCIVGVNNASFEVSKGEMLSCDGFIWFWKINFIKMYFKINRCNRWKNFHRGTRLYLELNNKEVN
jgi:glycine betaine/proline transport system ATP-binding protein